MIEFLIGFIITLISLLIGYYLGKGVNPLPKETIEKVKRVFEALPNKSGVGAVERPSATQLEKFNNPINKAGEEETSKMFERLVTNE